MAIVYFLQEFFFDGSIYLSTSELYNRVAILPILPTTCPVLSRTVSNSIASSLVSPVVLSGYCTPLSIASVVYSELSSGFNIFIRASLSMCCIISQVSNTVNLRVLFSLIYHKIKTVTIFSIYRMVYSIHFLPYIYVYLWEKCVSV